MADEDLIARVKTLENMVADLELATLKITLEGNLAGLKEFYRKTSARMLARDREAWQRVENMARGARPPEKGSFYNFAFPNDDLCFVYRELLVFLPGAIKRIHESDHSILAKMHSFPCRDTILPLRDYFDGLETVADVMAIVKDDSIPADKATATNKHADVFSTTQLLTGQLLKLPDIAKFSLNKWVLEKLVPYADSFLKAHQQVLYEDKKGGAASVPSQVLENFSIAKTLIVKGLKIADVEPVEIKIGDRFDADKHMARSRSHDAELPDGTIASVVRNGFVQNGKQIRQPEVIVNRL